MRNFLVTMVSDEVYDVTAKDANAAMREAERQSVWCHGVRDTARKVDEVDHAV